MFPHVLQTGTGCRRQREGTTVDEGIGIGLVDGREQLGDVLLYFGLERLIVDAIAETEGDSLGLFGRRNGVATGLLGRLFPTVLTNVSESVRLTVGRLLLQRRDERLEL